MSKNPFDSNDNQRDQELTQEEESKEVNEGQGEEVIEVNEEEDYFYESLDRIAFSNSCSCSNSTSPSSDSDSDPITRSRKARHPFPVPKFPMAVSKFDVWVSEPASVSERRSRLLREMGLSRDPSLSRTRPGSETEVGPRREMGNVAAGGRGPEFERRSVSSDRLVKKELEEPDRSSSGIVRSKSNGDCNKLSVSSSILSVGLSFVNCNNNTECDCINVMAPNVRTCESNGSPCNKPLTGQSSKCMNGELGSKSFDSGDSTVENRNPSEQVCTIKNLDNGKEFLVKEIREYGMWNKLNEVGTGRQLTMEEFEMCAGHSPIVQELMRRQNVEENNNMDSADLDASGGGDVSKFKKKGGWFKSIKSAASSVNVIGHKERRSSDERDTSSEKGGRRSSSATDDSQDVPFHGPERVRVKQYGKSCKELTALYKSREIQAHTGSIWSIKFSMDGKYLASAGEDRDIHVWEVVESERKGELSMEKADDVNLNFLLVANGSPATNLLSPSSDHHPEKKTRGRLSISRKSLNLDHIVVPETVFALSDKPFCSFQGHSGDVLDLSWSKSQLLLSSSMDKTVRLWDLIRKTCLRIFSHSDYGCTGWLIQRKLPLIRCFREQVTTKK